MAGPTPLSDRWIEAILRRHRLILVVAAFATVIAGFFAARLRVNADLRALLPKTHPVVASLEQIEASFGSTNSVNFLAKGGTIEARHAFTDALSAELTEHPLLRDVEHGIPADFFSERGLYYLDEAEMEDLVYRVEAWNHYEVCTAAPENCMSKPDEEASSKLRAFIEDKRNKAEEVTGFSGRYEREGVEAEVLLAYPNEPASRLEAADEITDAMRAIAAEVYARSGQPWSDSGMTYNVLGSYITKSDEHRTVLRDMVKSGAFAVVGVVLVLYVLFRSNRAVLVLLIPLSCGVIWSLGVTQLTLGRLNGMTATISTVVMGVGIDAGIHFYSRAKRYRQECDDAEAITRAFRGLVVPLLIASSTTIGAFASMASSDFPAFHEFGIIAAFGVALCLLSMVTVLPALAYLVGIKKRVAAKPHSEAGGLTRMVMARPTVLFFLLVVVSAAAVGGARRVDFQYNVRELQSDAGRENSEQDAKIIAEIFGKDIHAAVLIQESVDDVRETLKTARARHDARKAEGTSVVADLFGASDLMPDPARDQQERLEEIEELNEEYEDLVEKLRDRVEEEKKNPKPDGEESIAEEDVDLLEAMLAAKPFTVDDLPPSLLSKLRAGDDHWAIYAYPGFDAANMRKGLVFMEELGAFLDNPGDSIFVGEAVLYAAMFLTLREEA
ncbi:MAG: MMPL family transporter, partial [Myxococcota bacterium]